MQAIRRAVSLALLNAGSNMAAKMAMMAITTSSSINVNALCALPEDEFPTNTFKKTFVDGRRLKLFTEKCPDHFRPCETTTLYLGLTSDGLTLGFPGCGRSSMVERQSSKLHTRVRFPSPAPFVFNGVLSCPDLILCALDGFQFPRFQTTKFTHPFGRGFYRVCTSGQRPHKAT